jgi:polyketide biosynthesis acyl carrier protein
MNIKSNIDKEYVREVLLSSVRQLSPALSDYKFAKGDSLASLGVNSMERVEIIVDALATLSLRIPMADTTVATNIDELVDLLYERISQH